MRFAYADPPYPGQAARHYGTHPDFAGEVDHAGLISRLETDFPEGWALSTSANALQEILALCPKKAAGRWHYHSENSGIRVGIWVKTNSPPCPPLRRWHGWEPVIFRGGRTRCRHSQDLVRDVFMCGVGSGFAGRKPLAFCQWLFDFAGLEPDDDFIDLFPGSGAVGAAWQAFRSQPRLLV